MSREPAFPKEAAVGDTAPGEAGHNLAANATKEADPQRNKHLMTGAAIGIGSAAIVAALLYARRSKDGDKGGRGQ